MKKLKSFFAFVLSFVMMLSYAPTVWAASVQSFPLRSAADELIADENTRYITEFTQDPESKIITATIQVQNNTTGEDAETLVVAGIGFSIEFSDKVAPYSDTDDLYVGPADVSFGENAVIHKYVSPVHYKNPNFSLLGSTIISNDKDLRAVSGIISGSAAGEELRVAPGQTAKVAVLKFMPVNGTDDIDLSMFTYRFFRHTVLVFSPYLGNGTRFVVVNEQAQTFAEYVRVISPESFKIHVKHFQPLVTADSVNRVVAGYDQDTMEWSDTLDGVYSSDSAPVIGSDAQTVYVRVKGDSDYNIGTDYEFVNYKKYVASESVAVEFDGDTNPEVSEYKVTYNVGTGDESDDYVVETEENEEYTILSPSDIGFTKEGCRFTEWNTSSDGTGTAYRPGQIITMVEDVTLYALWVEDNNVSGQPHPFGEKHSENLTNLNGNYIGDVIEYTIKVGNEEEGADWEDVTVTDTLPEGLTMTKGVTIDSEPAASWQYSYDAAQRTLTVSLGTIAGGETKEITFKTIIDADAQIGSEIYNEADVMGTDGEDEEVSLHLTDASGRREISEPADTEGPEVGAYTVKTSKNLTSPDDKTRVGDRIEYIITAGNNEKEGADNYFAALGMLNVNSLLFVGSNVQVNENSITETNDESITEEEQEEQEEEQEENQEEVTESEDDNETESKEEDSTEKDDSEEETESNEEESEETNEGSGEENKGQDSTWYQAVVTDEIPNYVTFMDGTVKVDGVITSDYTFENGVLTVMVGDIPFGHKAIVTFEGEIDADAYGQTIKNTATVTGKDAEDKEIEKETEEPNGGREIEGPKDLAEGTYASKKSENITSTDDKTRVKDTIQYTITAGNAAGNGLVWEAVKVIDELPQYVTFVKGSVKIDGNETEDYTFENGILTVQIGSINDGEKVEVTFEATVDENAYGKTIKNTATVTGQDDEGQKVEKEVQEPDGGRKVYDKSKSPIILPVPEGAKVIKGQGVAGSEIVITFPETGKTVTTTVDADGNWQVNVPEEIILKNGDKVEAVQTEDGKDASNKVTRTVDGVRYTVTYLPGIGTGSHKSDGLRPEETHVVLTQSGAGITSPSSQYTFTGWNTSQNGSGKAYAAGSTIVVTTNITLYAQWRYNGDGGGNSGGGNSGTPNRGGSNTVTIEETKTPLGALELNKTDHIRYIFGYPDQSIRPDNAITRAEAASIFFRLLLNADKNSAKSSTFSDVQGGVWYSQAINYLASAGIVSGYEDGTFRPNQPITRAEFATMASKFDKLEKTGDQIFPDIQDNHWAKDFVNSAYTKGWVSGYPDGTFRPQLNITRAEVVSIVNKMLERKIKLADIPAGVLRFIDLTESHWAYIDMMEASNEHDYQKDEDGYEKWTLR